MNITCGRCGVQFKARRSTRKWCDACKAKTWMNEPAFARTCKWCGATFTVERGAPHNRRTIGYCSREHARLGARRARSESAKRAARGEPRKATGRKPTLTPEERAKRRREGVVGRFFRNYPERARRCEALKPGGAPCGEARVIQLAHKKPRNGAWRSLANTKSEDVWVLCPTCHVVLDTGLATPEELGLTRTAAHETAVF